MLRARAAVSGSLQPSELLLKSCTATNTDMYFTHLECAWQLGEGDSSLCAYSNISLLLTRPGSMELLM